MILRKIYNKMRGVKHLKITLILIESWNFWFQIAVKIFLNSSEALYLYFLYAQSITHNFCGDEKGDGNGIIGSNNAIDGN
jgi:hypothetical protein